MERNLTAVEERDSSSLLDLYSYLMEHHRDRRYVWTVLSLFFVDAARYLENTAIGISHFVSAGKTCKQLFKFKAEIKKTTIVCIQLS